MSISRLHIYLVKVHTLWLYGIWKRVLFKDISEILGNWMRSQTVQYFNRKLFIAQSVPTGKDIIVWDFETDSRETLRTRHSDNVTSIAGSWG